MEATPGPEWARQTYTLFPHVQNNTDIIWDNGIVIPFQKDTVSREPSCSWGIQSVWVLPG
uniref:Uncharacterized protein n=1 Tax=Peromyscus maniculatus bairdii TaxID=230844 RepID=A0A8C8UB34_PERMB